MPRIRRSVNSKPPPFSRARPTAAGAIAHFIPTSARCHRLDPLPVKAAILADPFDPAQSVTGGTRYLRWLLDRFGGDVTLALAGYNAGEGAVERHGGIPPYRETRNYVRIVRSNHRLLRRWAEHLAREAR